MCPPMVDFPASVTNQQKFFTSKPSRENHFVCYRHRQIILVQQLFLLNANTLRYMPDVGVKKSVFFRTPTPSYA